LQYLSDHPFGPWLATYESYDGPESPMGTGMTPTEAVDALIEMEAEQ